MGQRQKSAGSQGFSVRSCDAIIIIAGERQDKALIVHELKDFKNYVKARRMVAKISEKVANQRKDYLNKITT